MIGYVSVEVQVEKDFDRALRKASLRRWRDRLRKDPDHDRLLSFDEAKGALARWSQVYRGMRTVEVEKIAGSVGRYRDFDGSFLPLKVSMGDRWSRIDRAYHRGKELPAVSLYKIGDAYFVRDGNHRVSVARYHGVAAIDAEVVELRGRTRTDAAQRPGARRPTRSADCGALPSPVRPGFVAFANASSNRVYQDRGLDVSHDRGERKLATEEDKTCAGKRTWKSASPSSR